MLPLGKASFLYMSTVAIVPAAGLGTRLRPLSDAIPKEMLPVGRQLALERIASELVAAGVDRILFVLSPNKLAMVRDYFGEGARFSYVVQSEMRGLGDAVLQAREWASGATKLLVALGDAVFEEPVLGGLTRRLLAQTPVNSLAIAVQRVPKERLSRYGIIAPKAAVSPEASVFAIADIIEKPTPEAAPSDFAVTARYVLPDSIFDVLQKTMPAANGEVQLTDALRSLLASGIDGVAIPLDKDEIRHDIGSLETYFKAFLSFALNDPDYGAVMRTHLLEKLHS
jgi:UTP--glucose-1-phosphate uridylyltransferase